MHYVYFIRSVEFPAQKYVGYTENMKKRVAVHNAGGSVHTAKYKPWELHACFAFRSKPQALDFEKYMKSHAGRAFASKRFW